MFLDPVSSREPWFKAKLTPGSLLEGAVHDDTGKPQGTVVIEVLRRDSTGPQGHEVTGKYVSASDSHYRWWMSHGAGVSMADKGVYHLCDGDPRDCTWKHGRKPAVHFGKFRQVTETMLQAKDPGWLFSRQNKPSVKPYLDHISATGGDEASPHLPWKGTVRESQADDQSEESTEGKALTHKLKKLKAELAEAEREAEERKQAKSRHPSKGVKKDSKKGPKGRKGHKPPKQAKKKKQKRRAETARSGEMTSDARRPKKKKRKKPQRSSSEGKRGNDEGEDDSRSEETSDEESSKSGLFGASAPDQGGRKQRRKGKVDRGPFGTGPTVRYNEEDSYESSDESVFRKASPGTGKASQLGLVQYCQRKPGRLASRMLLRMQIETARDPGEAIKMDEKKTPAAATPYLHAIMLPHLGQKASLRSIRELRTLAMAIDHLAKKQPAHAADVLSQRLKAVERATQEGHWTSAQHLELITPEQGGLLERDEQIYVKNETLLDQKLRSYDRTPWRSQGKGERKGEKGKDQKASKGEKGKGKPKKDEWVTHEVV